MMICNSQYPEILAFSFLTELQKEFLLQYKNEDIQRAKRPYTFVEFGVLFSNKIYAKVYIVITKYRIKVLNVTSITISFVFIYLFICHNYICQYE